MLFSAFKSGKAAARNPANGQPVARAVANAATAAPPQSDIQVRPIMEVAERFIKNVLCLHSTVAVGRECICVDDPSLHKQARALLANAAVFYKERRNRTASCNWEKCPVH